MELTYGCRSCGATDRVASIESAGALTCPRCGDTHPISPSTFEDGGLVACAVCGTEDLYSQKDFPQALGLAIVFIGFGVSSVFWYYERPLWTYAILLSSALLDMFLFYKVPDVSICYRCLSQYRGEGANPGRRFKFFDLGIGERYRQEKIRVDEHRRRERDDAGKDDVTRNV